MRFLKNINLEDVLFLDIETSTTVPELVIDTPLFEAWKYKKERGGDSIDNEEVIKSYKKEGALYADFGRIVCISVGRLFNGEFVTTTFNNLDEKTMIQDFYKVLDKQGWTLCGHAVKGFDLPYIFQRSIINGIPPHSLVDVSGLKPWELSFVIDTKELWAGSGFNQSSLLSITTAFGLPSPKEKITGAQVPSYYWENPSSHIQEISEYCERDVKAVYEVLSVFQNPTLLSDKKVEVEKDPLIQYLFNGGKYTATHKKKLIKFIGSLSSDEKDQVFLCLDALVSNASGKVTNITKLDVNELRGV